jgi:hypothetical protein
MNKIKKIFSYVLYILLCILCFYVGSLNCKKIILSDEIKLCESKGGELSLRYIRYLQEYQTECELPAKTIFENTYK